MSLNTIWDPVKWKNEFSETNADYRALNKKVFNSTVNSVKNGYYLLPNGLKVSLESSPNLAADTKMYSEPFVPVKRVLKEQMLEVVADDCLVVAKKYVDKEIGKVAVLNMASAINPGGGVHKGSAAQEEYLFRCSDYYKSLYQYVDYAEEYGVKRNTNYSYPLDRNYGGVYSPDITIFRGSIEEGYPFLEKPWKVNFIAVAGVNRPTTKRLHDGSERIIGTDLEVTRNKLRTILNIAIDNNIDILVLSAIGCGAFKNPPEHIALLFKELIKQEKYKNAFKKIVFAIKQDHNSLKGKCGKTLYDVFSEALCNKSIEKDLDALRKQENIEILEHLLAVKKIIECKCKRCENKYGCLGCIYSHGELLGVVDNYIDVLKSKYFYEEGETKIIDDFKCEENDPKVPGDDPFFMSFLDHLENSLTHYESQHPDMNSQGEVTTFNEKLNFFANGSEERGMTVFCARIPIDEFHQDKLYVEIENGELTIGREVEELYKRLQCKLNAIWYVTFYIDNDKTTENTNNITEKDLAVFEEFLNNPKVELVFNFF